MNARLAFAVALVLGAASTYAAAKQPSKRHSSLSFASLPSCSAGGLSLSFIGEQAAMGHGVLGFSLKNTSSSSCTTRGYPGVRVLDKADTPMPMIAAHATEDFLGSAPLRRLTVAPGATVSFRLVVTYGLTSTADCRTAYGLQMTPPRDSATLRTSITNGAHECPTTTVTPLQRGDSAYHP